MERNFMQTTHNSIHLVVRLCLALTLVALCGASALADSITYTVAVNTASINATTGFLNLQFNPGGSGAPAATATVSGFSSAGGTLGTTTNTGGVRASSTTGLCERSSGPWVWRWMPKG